MVLEREMDAFFGDAVGRIGLLVQRRRTVARLQHVRPSVPPSLPPPLLLRLLSFRSFSRAFPFPEFTKESVLGLNSQPHTPRTLSPLSLVKPTGGGILGAHSFAPLQC